MRFNFHKADLGYGGLAYLYSEILYNNIVDSLISIIEDQEHETKAEIRKDVPLIVGSTQWIEPEILSGKVGRKVVLANIDFSEGALQATQNMKPYDNLDSILSLVPFGKPFIAYMILPPKEHFKTVKDFKKAVEDILSNPRGSNEIELYDNKALIYDIEDVSSSIRKIEKEFDCKIEAAVWNDMHQEVHTFNCDELSFQDGIYATQYAWVVKEAHPTTLQKMTVQIKFWLEEQIANDKLGTENLLIPYDYKSEWRRLEIQRLSEQTYGLPILFFAYTTDKLTFDENPNKVICDMDRNRERRIGVYSHGCAVILKQDQPYNTTDFMDEILRKKKWNQELNKPNSCLIHVKNNNPQNVNEHIEELEKEVNCKIEKVYTHINRNARDHVFKEAENKKVDEIQTAWRITFYDEETNPKMSAQLNE